MQLKYYAEEREKNPSKSEHAITWKVRAMIWQGSKDDVKYRVPYVIAQFKACRKHMADTHHQLVDNCRAQQVRLAESLCKVVEEFEERCVHMIHDFLITVPACFRVEERNKFKTNVVLWAKEMHSQESSRHSVSQRRRQK